MSEIDLETISKNDLATIIIKKDYLLKEQGKELKDLYKEIERLNNTIHNLQADYGTKAQVERDLLEIENKRLHSIIKEVREKLLCYGETFDLKLHQQMQKELLEILEKVEEK